MRLQNPMSVVTPTLDGDVLMALASTSRAFTAGDLHRLIGQHSHTGIRKVLLRLELEGIVDAENVGNAIAYRFNSEHIAAPAITELAQLRSAYFERLRAEFQSWDPAPVFAAMFGSAARGEMGNSSDIDLFVVRPDGLDDEAGERWDGNLLDIQHRASRWTGNDVRALEMGEAEVIENLHAEPVLEAIRYDGVVLYGSSGFWRRAYAKNAEVHASNT
ncbi:nucleotidyltransferase domain-containing protein [Nocardioides sp.]|uniref:nucleotidyltransferase domain-containing protein n=1 Tax=Nocardioides sp. TaxID=35761 RepID=UPI003783F987